MLLKHRQSNKTPPLSKNNKGVTLVELIAVIAVLSVVIAAVTGFVITGAKMSSNVSGKATGSIKEQTAVEFINARIWGANATVEDQISESNHSYDGYYGCLKLGEGIYIKTENPDKDNATVVYCIGENKKIELCPGSIYFKIENKTVTYVLNEKEHVVYPRIGS